MKAGDLLVLRDIPFAAPGVLPPGRGDKADCCRYLGESLLIIQLDLSPGRLVKVLTRGRFDMVINSYLETFYEVIS